MFESDEATILSLMTIREAVPKEADEVAALIRRSMAEFEGELPGAALAAMREGWAERLKQAPALVAHTGDRLAGAVICSVTSQRAVTAAWPPSWAVIGAFAVEPAFRRKGVGRSLIEECLGRARRTHVERVAARAAVSMVAARGALERCGFVRAPEFDDSWTLGYVIDL